MALSLKNDTSDLDQVIPQAREFTQNSKLRYWSLPRQTEEMVQSVNKSFLKDSDAKVKCVKSCLKNKISTSQKIGSKTDI